MANEFKCNVCKKSSLQKCARCQQVYYCSKEHQAIDWKEHKIMCTPFQIMENSKLGRFLSATRFIQPNEVVLKEKPLVFGPSQDTVPVCLGCNQEISAFNNKTCVKCGWLMCSTECENNPCHIPECYYFAKGLKKVTIDNFGSISSPYECVIILRCLYQKTHNIPLWKKIISLESHCENRTTTEKYYKDEIMVKQLLANINELQKNFSVEEIMKICGIIMVNAHEVPLSEPPYIAIYEKASMFENDCSSNCSKSFTNFGEILITSGTHIKRSDHLSICYSDPLWNTIKRRNFLYDSKYFWCMCKRCSDPTEFGTYFSAFCCQNGTCNGYLLPKNFLEEPNYWLCNKCEYSVATSLVDILTEKISEELACINKSDIESSKRFLRKLKSVLPLNSSYLVEIKFALNQSIGHETADGLTKINSEDLEMKRLLGLELAKLTEILIPSEKRIRGLIFFEMHACLAEFARRKSNNSAEVGQTVALLQESKMHLLRCIDLLKFEPEILPEGKICEQARKNMVDLIKLLEKQKHIM